MEEKKRTIVMFGDSLTDYFPMEKLKDIDAQFINSGVAGDTIADLEPQKDSTLKWIIKEQDITYYENI